MPEKRITLGDIAQVCGCSIMTVSYALRDLPSVSKETRRRVHQAARRLRYEPDPALSALVAYRRARYPMPTAAPLAWVSNVPGKPPMTEARFSFVDLYFKGAVHRAREIGYRIECFNLRDPGMTAQRMSRILHARGITGILLPPQPSARAHLNLDWGKFSTVTFGYSLVRPRFHMITTHHSSSMVMLMRKLRSLGYRRIGLQLSTVNDSRVHHNSYAAFLVEQNRLREADRVPPLYVADYTDDDVTRWIRTHGPEAVITCHRGIDMLRLLEERGFRVPRDLGLVAINCEQDDPVSGANENYHEVGEAAVDMLVTLMHRNERGIPRIRRSILIDSTWNEGTTVRRIHSSTLAALRRKPAPSPATTARRRRTVSPGKAVAP